MKNLAELLRALLTSTIYDLLKLGSVLLFPFIIIFFGRLYLNVFNVVWEVPLSIILTLISCSAILSFLLTKKHYDGKFVLIKNDLHTDQLTGLPNNRALDRDMSVSISEAKRNNTNLSVILIDIDNFGEINTKKGQLVADKVLVRFAEFLSSDKRITDTVYRQHGDEFVIIAKNTNLDGALIAANRKRE